MKAFVTDSAGAVWQMPPAQMWEMEYGVGTPCDSFFLRCPWKMGMGTKPKTWVKFHAEHQGKRVFTGVVDECEVSIAGQGCSLELSGRGMAALLLDNEALGQDYHLATLDDILRDHVTPYGIETLPGAKLPHVSRFRVDTGSSEWTVLEEFAAFYGGMTPRFDSWGRLVLSDWEDDAPRKLDSNIPVTSLVHRDCRYGVLSEILVRDRYSGAVQRVKNEAFCALGGRARRVLTMPGHAQSNSMRRSGRYQLQRSQREWEELEITVPTPFYAMPGQLIDVQRYGFDDNGLYRVNRSVSGMDENGYWTRLILRAPEKV